MTSASKRRSGSPESGLERKPQSANSPGYQTPPIAGQPGAPDERREDPMPDRPEAEKPYPRDAQGPKGV